MELDAYCRKRHIELVPSIACFGHLYKVLRTKTYGELCEMPGMEKEPFGFVDRMRHHTLDVSNPESIQLVTNAADVPHSILISVRTKLLIWEKEKVQRWQKKKEHSACIWIL